MYDVQACRESRGMHASCGDALSAGGRPDAEPHKKSARTTPGARIQKTLQGCAAALQRKDYFVGTTDVP